jgi:hypothetical protein
MEQSPSWEANRFSSTQEISRHFTETKVLLPHSQKPYTHPYSVHARGNCELYVTRQLAQFQSWRTTPCRLSATAYSIYIQLHTYWRPFLHPQHENSQWCGYRDPLITELSVVFIYRRGPVSLSGQTMWCLWQTKWQWDKLHSEYFRFSNQYHSALALPHWSLPSYNSDQDKWAKPWNLRKRRFVGYVNTGKKAPSYFY